MYNPKMVGAVLGLIIGIVLVGLGPLEALIAALFCLAGWLIGKYIGGEVPIIDALLERFVAGRSRRPPE